LATANVTLNGSLQYQPIAMTSLGQSITLPAANGLATGGPQFILDNTKGTYSVGIRDNTGTLIMAIAPGGEALVALKDNSSAAGVWAVTGSQLEPGLITVDNLFSATYAATYLAPYAALDSNTSIHFVALASNGFAAVVVDNAGKVLTTPVTVSTTANSVPVAAFRVDATHALVFFGSSTTDHQAVVLSLSGSSPTFSLAVGTAASLTGTFSAAWGGENSVSQPRIAQLAGSQYLFVTISGTNTAAVSISVSGTTVSIGALTNIITSNSNANTQAVYPLTATTGLVLYVSGAAAPYTVNAVVVTSSGTTSTIGTPAAGGTLASVSGAPMSCLLSATKAIFASDNNSATTMQCQAVTISAGTSVAIGAALSVETAGGTVASPNNTYTAWGSGSWTGTRTNPHLFGTAANSAIFSYADSTAISRVCTLSESGGVLTKGATVYQSLMPNSSNGEGLLLPPGSSTEFLAAQVQTDSTTTHGRPFVTPHLINGTVVTTGHEVTLADAENIVNSLSQTAATRLSQGDYLIGFCGPNSNNRLRILNVLRSNGVQLNNRGSLKMPNFQPLSMPLQAPASNRAVILGRTVASTAGTATSQLRLLNLEIAA